MPSKKNKNAGHAYDLDGRTLEGGGQLLRLALGLSALTGQALNISNIRGNRRGGGGLKAQHLACVHWLGQASHAQVEGADIKSQKLSFRPATLTTPPQTRTYKQHGSAETSLIFESRIDVGSPGSIALVLQAVLPFILFSPPRRTFESAERPLVRLVISGGTNVTNSPSYEYLSQVLFPTLALIGLPPIEANLVERGWSTGGTKIGSATSTIPTLKDGEKLPAFTLAPPGDIQEIRINPARITATLVAPEQVWNEFRQQLLPCLQALCSISEDQLEVILEVSGHEKRVYMILVATVVHNDREFKLASDELLEGRKNAKGESMIAGMVHRVTANLVADIHSGACVDRYMMDQLVAFQALADGKSHVWRGSSSENGHTLGLHRDTVEWISGELVGAQLKTGKGRGAGFAARACGDDKDTEDMT